MMQKPSCTAKELHITAMDEYKIGNMKTLPGYMLPVDEERTYRQIVVTL